MHSDAEVIVLQKRLKAIGLYKGAIDGDFGPATLAASLEGDRKSTRLNSSHT